MFGQKQNTKAPADMDIDGGGFVPPPMNSVSQTKEQPSELNEITKNSMPETEQMPASYQDIADDPNFKQAQGLDALPQQLPEPGKEQELLSPSQPESAPAQYVPQPPASHNKTLMPIIFSAAVMAISLGVSGFVYLKVNSQVNKLDENKQYFESAINSVKQSIANIQAESKGSDIKELEEKINEQIARLDMSLSDLQGQISVQGAFDDIAEEPKTELLISRHGFELSYPKDWRVILRIDDYETIKAAQDAGDNVVVLANYEKGHETGTAKDIMIFAWIDGALGKTLNEWVLELNGINTMEDIAIGGSKGKMVQRKKGDGYVSEIYYADGEYGVMFVKEPFESAMDQEFEAVASSFRFVFDENKANN